MKLSSLSSNVPRVWYVYVDSTREVLPRVFYVGKGNQHRVADFSKRNKVWHAIATKYGIQREVVFESKDEQECLSLEQKLIAQYNTFTNASPDSWGANLCIGGNGPTGAKWQKESKKLLSKSITDLWKQENYRISLMVVCPVSVEQLSLDNETLTWDNIAVKYAVSVTTVKRWFKQNNLRKFVVAQKRKSWSVKEEEQLLSLYSTGFLVRQISAELHRSECSVKKRIQRLCNDKIRSRYRRYEKCA